VPAPRAELRRRLEHLGEVVPRRLEQLAPARLAAMEARNERRPVGERLQRGERRRRSGTDDRLELRPDARRGDDSLQQLAIAPLRARAEQLARVPDERLRQIALAAEPVVELHGLLVVRRSVCEPRHPRADLEHEGGLLHAGARRAQDAGDAGEADVRVERGERGGAFARERPQLVPQRREQLPLMRVLLGERVRPRLLVPAGGRVSQPGAGRSCSRCTR
jgi:hypothetical protein